MKKITKLFDPFVDNKEERAIISTLKSHMWASGSGENKVKQFEENFKKYLNAKNCISVNSGTAALHLALSLLNIKNKEVILPSLSFVTTAHAVKFNGGIPIFVDIDPFTCCIDTNEIESKITSKTKIILPVHFAGFPCNIKSLEKICKKNNLRCVDDAAHATGTTYNKKKIGSFNFLTCFSFHPVKTLAMPIGGCITFGNESKNFSEILKSRRWCGISNRKGSIYSVNELGWNYYMNEFSAAVGLEQIKKLNKIISRKHNIAKRYETEIKNLEKIPLSDDCSYHLYWLKIKHRTKFMKYMLKNQIETGIHYKPIHKMKFYNQKQKLPFTDQIGNNIVSIPIHPNLTDDEVSKTIKLINNFSRSF